MYKFPLVTRNRQQRQSRVTEGGCSSERRGGNALVFPDFEPGETLAPESIREGDKGGGKASPGEKSFGKPSVVDREAKRNVPPRDPIPTGNLGCGQSPP